MATIDDYRLLRHPFYRRWEDGSLQLADLAAYAGQYRHFEAALPGVLEDVANRLEDPDVRGFLEKNLRDECSVPEAHLTLFDRFADAVGAERPAPTPATARLVQLYERWAVFHPVDCLAALVAYEVQAAEVASTKARSLRTHYGIDDAGTAFWEVHAEIDREHRNWMTDALNRVSHDPKVLAGVQAGARAWWEFLDERQLAASQG